MAKYTLAYDGGCGFCKETAEKAAAESNGRLDIQPLQSTYVAESHHALGMDPPAQPVLIKESIGGKIQIYRGARLSTEILAKFGIGKSYRILRRIGESRLADTDGRISRSGLFRAAAGLGVVSAATLSMNDAVAKSPTWIDGGDTTSMEELSSEETRKAIANFMESDKATELSRISKELEKNRLLNSETEHKYVGFRFPLDDGGVRYSVGATIDSLSIAHHSLTRNGNLEDEAAIAIYSAVDSEQIHKVFELDAEGVWARDLEAIRSLDRTSSQGAAKPLATCNDSACRGKGHCYQCQCTSVDKNCLMECCGTCAVACVGGKAACLACAIAVCGWCASWSGKCCTSSACKRRQGKTC